MSTSEQTGVTLNTCAAWTTHPSLPGRRIHHLWFSSRFLLFLPQVFHDPVWVSGKGVGRGQNAKVPRATRGLQSRMFSLFWGESKCPFLSVATLYSLSSEAPGGWAILREHVTVALKTWSDSRWQRGINSSEAVRYRACDVRLDRRGWVILISSLHSSTVSHSAPLW